MNNSPCFTYFITKYSNDNNKLRDSVINQYNKDYYDQLSNFYIDNTQDVSKSFKKYKGFEYIKVITRKDVYDLMIDKPTDSCNGDPHADLLHYYHNGLITKEDFLNNFNQPDVFLSHCIPWEEFVHKLASSKHNIVKKSNNDLQLTLKNLQLNIKTKPFDFKEYYNLKRKTKISTIINYFPFAKH